MMMMIIIIIIITVPLYTPCFSLSVCLPVSGLKCQATHAPAGSVYRLYSGRGKHLNTRIIITCNCWPSCRGKKVNVSVRKKGQTLYLTCWVCALIYLLLDLLLLRNFTSESYK
jgi:hypothetical protein